MNFSEKFLKTANSFVNTVIIVILFISALYAGYSLWDNYRVYAQAENVQEDLLRFKPNADGDRMSVKLSFEELRNINKDVCAWLTIDNTNIDYPILQGEDNMAYVNTDVYGDFSLAGSIFLDYRCAKDFSDPYSIVYGHHMSDSKMFGDIDKYKKKKFFDENKTGVLITPNKTFNLKIFAVLVVPDSNQIVFNPNNSKDLNKIIQSAEDWSLYSDKAMMSKIKNNPSSQVVALSTCSNEFTDARTVLLAQMIPRS
ncbi:MAG: class B sortase [Ruminococcus sp.]|nr:class B sortase [Candidatus Copronaster equi]